MQSWSYRVEEISVRYDEQLVARLDELGGQGWECFQLETVLGGLLSRTYRCWLKRPGRPLDPSEAALD